MDGAKEVIANVTSLISGPADLIGDSKEREEALKEAKQPVAVDAPQSTVETVQEQTGTVPDVKTLEETHNALREQDNSDARSDASSDSEWGMGGGEPPSDPENTGMFKKWAKRAVGFGIAAEVIREGHVLPQGSTAYEKPIMTEEKQTGKFYLDGDALTVLRDKDKGMHTGKVYTDSKTGDVYFSKGAASRKRMSREVTMGYMTSLCYEKLAEKKGLGDGTAPQTYILQTTDEKTGQVQNFSASQKAPGDSWDLTDFMKRFSSAQEMKDEFEKHPIRGAGVSIALDGFAGKVDIKFENALIRKIEKENGDYEYLMQPIDHECTNTYKMTLFNVGDQADRPEYMLRHLQEFVPSQTHPNEARRAVLKSLTGEGQKPTSEDINQVGDMFDAFGEELKKSIQKDYEEGNIEELYRSILDIRMCRKTLEGGEAVRGRKVQAAYEALEDFLGEAFYEERERVRLKGLALHDALSKYDDSRTPLDQRFTEGTVIDAVRNRGPEGEMGREYSVPVPLISTARAALGGDSDKKFVDALRREKKYFLQIDGEMVVMKRQ